MRERRLIVPAEMTREMVFAGGEIQQQWIGSWGVPETVLRAALEASPNRGKVSPDALREAVAAARDEYRRLAVEGTSDHKSGYGPPYKAPWFLIDAATAEPEVNWPGDLVAAFENPHEADMERWRLSIRAAIEALGLEVEDGEESSRE